MDAFGSCIPALDWAQFLVGCFSSEDLVSAARAYPRGRITMTKYSFPKRSTGRPDYRIPESYATMMTVYSPGLTVTCWEPANG